MIFLTIVSMTYIVWVDIMSKVVNIIRAYIPIIYYNI